MARTLRHRLRIGRRRVRVRLVDRFDVRHQVGEWDPRANLINILEDQDASARVEVLWHEVLHAVWPKQLRRRMVTRYGREEETIRLVSPRLLRLLADPSWLAVVKELRRER